MCGILGIIATKKDEDIANHFAVALEKLSHRGPNLQTSEVTIINNTTIILGHARLSVIDLTSDASQPMTTSDGRYSIIFNGEIYNYLELRKLLDENGYLFNTKSDTEVLLAAWATWGKACLDRVIGMFAFVILDRKYQTISLVRDCFGIKPLFTSKYNSNFYFSSELPALLALRGVGVGLNFQRSYDYLVHGDYDSNTETFVDGVNQLPPGCIQVFNINSNKITQPIRWWNPSAERSSTLSFKQASEKLREMFLASVKLHLRSDVPLGAALSGGIDSSSVVCAIRHVEPNLPINTFSFIVKNSPLSEEYWVDLVNDHVKAKVHKVSPKPSDLFQDLDDMIMTQGEPFGTTSIYAQYRVFQLAKKNGMTVTLDGQGADELLAGYNGYPGKRTRSLLAEGDIVGAAKFLNAWAQWPGRSLSHGIKLVGAELLEGDLYQYARAMVMKSNPNDWLNDKFLAENNVNFIYPLKGNNSKFKDRVLIEALINASTKRGLPALLRHADRNSMRFSIESRVPFLTADIANFLFSLPEEFLISKSGETKSIFRSAMRGIVPDEILDRRDKIGFATPESDWLKEVFITIPKWIDSEKELFFLRHDVIRKKIQQALSGQASFTPQVWRWINFYKWYELVLKPLQTNTRNF